MHARSLITNVKFTYKDQRRKLLGMSKYYQHRNDKAGASHVRQYDEFGKRIPRWVNGGLGTGYRDITATCLDYGTQGLKRDVGARLLVIAPEVNFMHAIPAARRTDILQELTEYTLATWFERMDLPTVEYAYVLHEAEASKKRPDGQEKTAENATQTYLHTHVILAPTVAGIAGRENYKVYEQQISLLHEAGREAMQHLWERELGAERVSELTAELEQREAAYKAQELAAAEAFFAQTAEQSMSVDLSQAKGLDDDWD